MKTAGVEVSAEIARAVDEMPAISPVVGKLEHLNREMNPSPKELVKVIMLDPVLTGKVIRLVNSSFYGLDRPVRSLAHAVVLLGMNTVKNLAVSTAVLGAVMQKEEKNAFDYLEFWRHCLGTAVACRLSAGRAGAPRRELETYFVAGLLHDIGKILLGRIAPRVYRAAVEEGRREEVSLVFAEAAHFGHTHTEAGGALARKWKLDAALTEAVERHHDVFSAPLVGEVESRTSVVRPVNTVRVADDLCRRRGIGASGNFVFDEAAEETAARLGLGDDDLAAVAARLPEELEKAAEFLQVARKEAAA